jgi:hypothetical protein
MLLSVCEFRENRREGHALGGGGGVNEITFTLVP